MKARWPWYFVVTGIIFLVFPLCWIIWDLIMTPALWGEKSPLIYLMLKALCVGVGFTITGQAIIAGFMNTVSRSAKKRKPTIAEYEEARLRRVK
jgi:hypothetical protein